MPRPGHADFVASRKFGGFEDYRGGGHFSGRLTLGLVAAGVIAKKIIGPMKVEARLTEAGGMSDIEKAVEKAIAENDSIGGIVECRVSGCARGSRRTFFRFRGIAAWPISLLPYRPSKALNSDPGFKAAVMRGQEHNDNIISADGTTGTNYAGGINGGITNGNDIVFRVAVKPASSTSQPQETLNVKTGKIEELIVEGRHDKCIALRVPPVLEGATAIVLADLMMLEGRINRIFKQENF